MALRTLTFGDIESGIWGAAWNLDDGPGFVLVGDAENFAAPEAALSGEWAIAGEEARLESSPTGHAAELERGFDQLARIRGRVRIGGAERPIDCLGRRGARETLDAAGYESIRDVSAWFPSEDGVALLAARPEGARGHDGELLTVSAFEAGRPLPIADPRLSTTYAADGSPIRASLELWLERRDDQEEPGGETVLYPRRAAGEEASSVAATTAGSLGVEARLFRWHSRGEEGAGVYVIVRPS